MSTNNLSQQSGTMFLRVRRNVSDVTRPLFQIDARGDLRPGTYSMASGDSNEAVTELLRRRTMLDIVRHAIERRRNSESTVPV
ncbi:hypothetical protein PGB90_005780 [Kerria lacca]